VKLIKWTEQALDRLKWKAIVEKANTLSELQRRKRRRKRRRMKRRRRRRKREEKRGE
jgi:hypothetical protein